MLVAGGRFANAEGDAADVIAQWDGATWAALDSGLPAELAFVTALTLWNGDLVAAAYNEHGGTANSRNVVCWNATAAQWTPLGSGVGEITESVLAIASFGGRLVAGGAFSTAGGVRVNHTAQWDGDAWLVMDTGVSGTVNALLGAP